MIGVVHLGLGNIGSLARALTVTGVPWRLLETPDDDLEACTRLVFPGVGHYAPACHRLDGGWRGPLNDWIESDRPFLGICLGYQLLYEGSDEAPGSRGLGALAGTCRPVPSRKSPHMGWNRLVAREGDGFAGSWMYFVHSFAAPVSSSTRWSCEDEGASFSAGSQQGALAGVQFHPEKSHQDGQRLLTAFAMGEL